MKNKTDYVNNLNNRTPSDSVRDYLQKGLFMKSQIYADIRAKCALCGNQQFETKEIAAFDNTELPVCTSCGGNPDKYRIRRTLPVGTKGGAKRLDIRFDQSGKRLTKPYQVTSLISILDQQIMSEKFDPAQYQSDEVRLEYIFKTFVENEYGPAQLRKYQKGELTKSSYRNKKTTRNHLLKIFSEIDIREITRGTIRREFDSFEGGSRTRDLVFSELRVILRYAFDLEKIELVPSFPEFKTAKKINRELLISREDQMLIVSKIEPWYQTPIKLLIKYAVRPCDVRALRVNDFDFENMTIKFDEHDSAGELETGRKSDSEACHLVPIDNETLEILKFTEFSSNPNDFVFKGRKGELMSEKVLNEAWKRAKEKLKLDNPENFELAQRIKDTTLYVGTRHSTLSQLKQKGVTSQRLQLLTGHTSVRMVDRYAQHNDSSKLAEQKKILEILKVGDG